MMRIRTFLLLLIIASVAACFSGTYYIAYQLDFAVEEHSITQYVYYPWAMWLWMYSYYDQNEQLFSQAVVVFLGTGVVSYVVPWFIIAKFGSKITKVDDLHGSARWANYKEVKESGLMNVKSGVQLGGFEHRGSVEYLVHEGNEHVLVMAPTRSGKGISIVVPTLHRWVGSLICLDIKGENWALTSKNRQERGQYVMQFDPTDRTGLCAKWNPLLEIDFKGPDEVRDIQNITSIMSNPDGTRKEDHFMIQGRALLSGFISYLLRVCEANGKTPSIYELDGLIAEAQADLQDENKMEAKSTILHKMQKSDFELVKRTGMQLLGTPDKERGSIFSTANSFLELYRDPIIAKNTSESSFKIHDIVNSDRPVSLYIVLRPSDMKRLLSLMRILITLIVSKLTENMEFKDGRSVKCHKHKLLLLLDEFPQLGKLPIIEEALAFMAGYGIQAVLITQDYAQIQKAYTREEGIMGNCHIKVAYAPNKQETADLLSKMTGDTTVLKKSVSSSADPGALWSERVNESYQETKRPLMTPEEVMRLPGLKKNGDKVVDTGEVLIFIAGKHPIKGKQTPYFMDSFFQQLCLKNAPIESDSLHAVDTSPLVSNEIGGIDDIDIEEVKNDWHIDDYEPSEPDQLGEPEEPEDFTLEEPIMPEEPEEPDEPEDEEGK